MSTLDPHPAIVEQVISQGVEFLRRNQQDDGEFATYIGSDIELRDPVVFDSSAFVTAYTVYCLSHVSDPAVETMVSKALDFLVSEMEGSGMWRFFSSRNFKHSRIPIDLDSISCISYALGMFGRKFPANEHIVLRNRDKEGRFLVWVAPSARLLFSDRRFHFELRSLQSQARAVQPPIPEQLRDSPRFQSKVDKVSFQDVDPVVTANVILYLGESDATKEAIGYLVQLVNERREDNANHRYGSPLVLYYMMSRAHLHSAPSLGEAGDTIVSRLSMLQRSDGCFGASLLTGLAACTLARLAPETPAFYRAIKKITDTQNPDGSWPPYAFYSSRFEHWGSRELTTAVCLEALALYKHLQAGSIKQPAVIIPFGMHGRADPLSSGHIKQQFMVIRRRLFRRIDFDVLSPEYIDNPYPRYHALRRDSPLNNFDDRGYRTVSRYADVASVLMNPELFSSAAAPQVEDGLIEADPPGHDRIREGLINTFSLKTIKGFEQRIQGICNELLGAAARRTEFDLVRDFAIPLPTSVAAEIFGLPEELMDRFTELYKGTLLRVSGRTDAEARIHATRNNNEFESFLEQHLDRCRDQGNCGSLTYTILAMTDDQLLTARQAIRLLKVIMIAAAETTTGLIANSILTLLKNPSEMQLIKTAPALIPNLVDEVLRYESSVQFVRRWAKRDAKIGGVQVPAGTQLLVLIGSANRDERQFDDPDRFSIKRNSRAHLAFGGGPHFCLGANLARLEAHIALRSLLFDLPQLELARPHEPVEMSPTLQIRVPKRLDLTCTER